MKSAGKFAMVLVTAPDLRTARKLGQAALNARLIACANLLPKLESHYWWKGKLEHSAEVLMILKTKSSNLPALEKLILDLHPYETPEFIAVPLMLGNWRYLDWINASCAGPAGGVRKG